MYYTGTLFYLRNIISHCCCQSCCVNAEMPDHHHTLSVLPLHN